jgi:hypothetical protein
VIRDQRLLGIVKLEMCVSVMGGLLAQVHANGFYL